VSNITKKLSQAEIAVLEKAVVYYGRQPHRWEIICKDHLPHRHPMVLSVLWAEYQKSGENGDPGEIMQEPALVSEDDRATASAGAGAGAPYAVSKRSRSEQQPPAAPFPDMTARKGDEKDTDAPRARTAKGAEILTHPWHLPRPATVAPCTEDPIAAWMTSYGPEAVQHMMQIGWHLMMGLGLDPGLLTKTPGTPDPAVASVIGAQTDAGMPPCLQVPPTGGMYMPLLSPEQREQQQMAAIGEALPGLTYELQVGEKRAREEEAIAVPIEMHRHEAEEQQPGELLPNDRDGWAIEADRIILQAGIAVNGVLTEAVAADLVEKMGYTKSVEDVMQRGLLLMERFKEKAKQRSGKRKK